MFKNFENADEKHLLLSETDKSKRKGFYGTSSESLSSDKASSDSLISSYPTAVIFVLLSKTFEAFAANGVRSILALYLRDSLQFNEDFSTAILHTFNFFSQFLPIIGAILADSYLGNAKTIFIFCFPYAIGYIGTFLGTLPYPFETHSLIYSSLLFIAIGNGCLRACITALGGHQFKLPQQKQSLDRYFALYYFFYYFGILLGKIIPPYVRSEVEVSSYCEERGECYPAAFGVIVIVFFISWAIFLSGLPFYKREYASGDNTMLKVLGCVTYATYRKITGKSKGIEWIKGSVGKYSEEFVNDVSIFLKVITLFIPMPVYYALLAQQDSTWTFQATMTNTTIGGMEIQADQFKAIGPVLLLIQIPVWQKIVLPLMEKCNFHLTSLESVSIGGLCAAFSFLCAGILQDRIADNPEMPPSVLWQLPMFFLLMMGEVLISVPGLKFCYTHAPSSMKSVLTAVWFINNAMGNLLVVLLTELRMTENKSIEFFFYAFLMFTATIIFTILSENYEKSNQNGISVSAENTIEAFVFGDAIQSTNLEENFLDNLSDNFDSDDDGNFGSFCVR